MRIDLNNLLSGVETKLDINYVLDLSNLIYSTYNPIKNGVVFTQKLMCYILILISASISLVFATDVQKR